MPCNARAHVSLAQSARPGGSPPLARPCAVGRPLPHSSPLPIGMRMEVVSEFSGAHRPTRQDPPRAAPARPFARVCARGAFGAPWLVVRSNRMHSSSVSDRFLAASAGLPTHRRRRRRRDREGRRAARTRSRLRAPRWACRAQRAARAAPRSAACAPRPRGVTRLPHQRAGVGRLDKRNATRDAISSAFRTAGMKIPVPQGRGANAGARRRPARQGGLFRRARPSVRPRASGRAAERLPVAARRCSSRREEFVGRIAVGSQSCAGQRAVWRSHCWRARASRSQYSLMGRGRLWAGSQHCSAGHSRRAPTTILRCNASGGPRLLDWKTISRGRYCRKS